MTSKPISAWTPPASKRPTIEFTDDDVRIGLTCLRRVYQEMLGEAYREDRLLGYIRHDRSLKYGQSSRGRWLKRDVDAFIAIAQRLLEQTALLP